jgi:hypothetical protein
LIHHCPFTLNTYHYFIFVTFVTNKPTEAVYFCAGKINNSIFMKQDILSNWNFMRFVRLGLGIAIIVQSIMHHDWTMGILGALFTAMPVFNIGCCAAGGCAAPAKKNNESVKDISYEEVV